MYDSMFISLLLAGNYKRICVFTPALSKVIKSENRYSFNDLREYKGNVLYCFVFCMCIKKTSCSDSRSHMAHYLLTISHLKKNSKRGSFTFTLILHEKEKSGKV